MSFPNPKHFFTSDPPQAPRRNLPPPPASSPPLPPQIIEPQGVTLVRESLWAGLADTLPQIPESSHYSRSRVCETPLPGITKKEGGSSLTLKKWAMLSPPSPTTPMMPGRTPSKSDQPINQRPGKYL